MLASLTMDFVGDTLYGTDVEISLVGVHPGKTSVTMEVSMGQGGVETVKGRAVLVFFDGRTRRPTPIPNELRDRLTAY